jgi:hypothetical protein
VPISNRWSPAIVDERDRISRIWQARRRIETLRGGSRNGKEVGEPFTVFEKCDACFEAAGKKEVDLISLYLLGSES